ncbi:MAG: hypothetical protein EA395_01440 [Phormidium sp. GEM2.Bin31]|nr:MAG: hypothetical protein EA395_01440 [Phormidium sp. GEM2.Bin31]
MRSGKLPLIGQSPNSLQAGTHPTPRATTRDCPYVFSIAYCLLPIAYCLLLPIAYCLLPSPTYCLLPVPYCLLPCLTIPTANSVKANSSPPSGWVQWSIYPITQFSLVV